MITITLSNKELNSFSIFRAIVLSVFKMLPFSFHPLILLAFLLLFDANNHPFFVAVSACVSCPQLRIIAHQAIKIGKVTKKKQLITLSNPMPFFSTKILAFLSFLL